MDKCSLRFVIAIEIAQADLGLIVGLSGYNHLRITFRWEIFKSINTRCETENQIAIGTEPGYPIQLHHTASSGDEYTL